MDFEFEILQSKYAPLDKNFIIQDFLSKQISEQNLIKTLITNSKKRIAL